MAIGKHVDSIEMYDVGRCNVQSPKRRSSSPCFDDAWTQSGVYRERTGKNVGSRQGEILTWPGGAETRICTNPAYCVLCQQLNNIGRFDDEAQRLQCPDFQVFEE